MFYVCQNRNDIVVVNFLLGHTAQKILGQVVQRFAWLILKREHEKYFRNTMSKLGRDSVFTICEKKLCIFVVLSCVHTLVRRAVHCTLIIFILLKCSKYSRRCLLTVHGTLFVFDRPPVD